MENVSLTHRIVGAIVILSLAIIFIPILLETDQINPGNIIDSPVPQVPPEIDSIVFELDERSGEFVPQNSEDFLRFEQDIKQKIDNSAKEVEIKNVAPVAKAEDKSLFPVDVDKPFKHTWMLQLASFKDQTKANDFRDKLRLAGYASHVNRKSVNSGTLFRVRIGPYSRKEEASQVLAKVNKAFRVKGILVQRR